MNRTTTRQGIFWLTFSVIALIAAAFSMALAPTARASYSLGNPAHFVYDDTNHWDNWSWKSSIDSNNPWPVYGGSKSIAVTYESAWAGLSLHTSGFDTSGYSNLEFFLFPNGKPLPDIDVSLYDSSDDLIKQLTMQPYASSVDNGWYEVSIPLADLAGTNRTIERVQLQDRSGSAKPTFYLDDLTFVSNEGTSPGPSNEGTSPGPSNERTSPSPDPNRPKPELGSYRPPEASTTVDNAIRDAVVRYNLPRWFYYALVHRESGFNRWAVGPYSEPGLTQLNGSKYEGEPYPENLRAPNDNDRSYYYDLNFPKFGRWINMSDVSRLDDPFDAEQNLDRFSSGYAVPAFYLFRDWYGLDDAEALRAVAYHWNKGLYKSYDPNNSDYLGTYDKYVNRYRWTVEDQDGEWDGKPVIP